MFTIIIHKFSMPFKWNKKTLNKTKIGILYNKIFGTLINKIESIIRIIIIKIIITNLISIKETTFIMALKTSYLHKILFSNK